jgi:N-acetylhexosamine 1-kinase
VNPATALAHFAVGGSPVGDAEPLGGGHINRTWLVRAGARRWVVQLLNTSVFADPDALMANAVLVAAHVRSPAGPAPTNDGRWWWHDTDGGAWRVSSFLEGTSPPPAPLTAATAAEVGRAFGAFHRATVDLDPSRLVEVLPDFHNPVRRLGDLDVAVVADRVGRRAQAAESLGRLDALRWVGQLADVMVAAPVRVAHFDAKPDNVLIDDATGSFRAVIDLDTVSAGSLLWDVGDLVRGAACPVAEDCPSADRALLDLDRYRAVMAGYLSEAGRLLTAEEREGLAVAPLVVTLEQAVRFLADHLDGDRYYRVSRPDHNLARANVALALLASMLDQRSAMEGGLQP